jgi:hypothetical protein
MAYELHNFPVIFCVSAPATANKIALTLPSHFPESNMGFLSIICSTNEEID